MSDIVIKVENLSKQYRLGEYKGYKTFREAIVDFAKSPFKRFSAALTNESNTANEISQNNFIWALKDLSFEIEQGEVVGVIGKNGAGKSTLLKILSMITDPTKGRVELRGRVGSLLEIGTGFHPELTGHENIYLYGAILGMDRWEVTRKFDEIVAFTNLEEFIETPVKRYSSGMYMRLAFAVAAHLETEILLVDEVLAVGDADFQKKCIGKMDDVSKQGRTIIFVSHQLNSIRKLCSQCIWLDDGRNRMKDSANKVVSAYEYSFSQGLQNTDNESGDERAQNRFISWDIVEPESGNPNQIDTSGPVKIRFVILLDREVKNGIHGIALWNNDNLLMWGRAAYNIHMNAGRNEFVYTFDGLPIRPGPYRWQVSLYENNVLVDNWHCVPEMIVATEPLGHPLDEWAGILNLPCGLEVKKPEM